MIISRRIGQWIDRGRTSVVRSAIPLTALSILVVLLALLTVVASRRPTAFANVPQAQRASVHPASAEPTSTAVITLTASGIDPAMLTITERTQVVWRNTTTQSHQLLGARYYPFYLPLLTRQPGQANSSLVISGALMSRAVTSPTFSTTLAAGGTFSYTFATAGQFAYFLDQSNQPLGRIIVQPGPPTISLGIVQPTSNAIVGDKLSVAVTANSLYELTSVVAQVDQRTANLVFTANAYCDRFGCHPGWSGDLGLSGLARGTHTLTVAATNVFSDVVVAEAPFVYDRLPELNVLAPMEATVARPQLHVAVTCADDDPAGCNQIVVASESNCYDPNQALATGRSSIDTTISLAAYEGQIFNLCIRAVDSANQQSSVMRMIYVESSAHLTETVSLGGPIWDVQPDRALYLDETAITPTLKIRDRSSGQDTIVASASSTTPLYGFLAPKGAIFAAQGPSYMVNVYEWRDGALVDLGELNSSLSLVVSGSYAIWNDAMLLVRRDLMAGTTVTISAGAGNTDNDVAANGDVVYWSSQEPPLYNIIRYRNGITTTLTSDSALWNTYPSTDGVNVVYRKHSPCCVSASYAIAMFGAGGETILAPSRSQEPIPDRDYQLNNGWIAFTKAGADGNIQVWTRSPAGVLRQVSFFGTSSSIDGLGPDGSVTFTNQQRLYLSQPNSTTMEIGSALGHSFWQDGHWLVIIGRSLFEITP
jgi:hypothetical protein